MMTTEILCKFDFHPVGQGLFYSGMINDYRFVYDCGSESDKKYLNSAILGIETKKLDLLIISHFHNDHINGIKSLLKRTGGVSEVVLPYYNMAERLLLLYEQIENGIDFDNDYIQFLENPESLFPDSNITYILPAGDDSIWDDLPEKRDDNKDFIWTGKIRADFELKSDLKGKPRTDKSIYYNLYWAFKFFCNPTNKQSKLISEFKKNGISLNGSDLGNTFISNFNKIKNIYHQLFKANKQNFTSIMCCHGPLIMNNNGHNIDFPYIKYYASCDLLHPIHIKKIFLSAQYNHGIKDSFQVWQVLAGDAEIEIKKYSKHFTIELDKIGLFQIPHHGSVKNWDDQLISIHPSCLIWPCSYGYGNKHSHPSSNVIDDLLKGKRYFIEINQMHALNITFKIHL